VFYKPVCPVGFTN